MNLQTVPIPAVAALMLGALALSLVSMKIQKVAYDVADALALDKESGISKRNLDGFVKRIVPVWSKVSAWISVLLSGVILVYVWMRFGWPWALGYIAVDHLLKSLKLPFLPTLEQIHSILQSEAQHKTPDKVEFMKRVQQSGAGVGD